MIDHDEHDHCDSSLGNNSQPCKITSDQDFPKKAIKIKRTTVTNMVSKLIKSSN